MLEEVKQRLSITGNDLDPTINGMIDDVVAFCLSAGVKYSQLVKPDVIGLIARGVADLWNYGAGDGKFSQVFHMRLNQLCIAAYSIDGDLLPQTKAVTITENGTTEITPDDGYLLTGVTVDTAVPGKPEQSKAVTIRENGITEVTPDAGHVLTGVTVEAAVPGKPEQTKAVTIRENGITEVMPDAGHVLTGVTVEAAVPGKPEQSKSVTITENGITQITPDEGKVLSGVSVSVDVAGGPGIITIPPVSFPIQNNILTKAIDIDLGSIEWAQASISNISNLFSRMTNLKTIKWGNLPKLLSENIAAEYMFANCESLENIDLSVFNNVRYISRVGNMFYVCKKLKNIVWNNIKVRSNSLYSMFYSCFSLETLEASFLDPEYDKVNNISYMFNQCYALKTVDLSNLKTAAITSADFVFGACSELTNIVFEAGCFSNTDLSELYFNGSPLSHDCAVDIFNKLATRTNSPMLKLSATTKGYLTESEIAIATGKGWVVS